MIQTYSLTYDNQSYYHSATLDGTYGENVSTFINEAEEGDIVTIAKDANISPHVYNDTTSEEIELTVIDTFGGKGGYYVYTFEMPASSVTLY